MTRLISGPVNVIRLEGNIFGIRKILYVFFDNHQSCNLETKCSDIFAENVTEYFINQFQNSDKDKIYDFFLETFPSRLRDSLNTNFHSIYIREMRNLMAKIITYEKKTNRVSSKIFPNIRLHYMDVRDYLYEEIFYFQSPHLISICQEIYTMAINGIYLTLENINHFENEIKKFYKNIYAMYNTFFPQQKGGRIIEPDMTPEIFANNQKYLINKIKNRYKHPEIKSIINKILNERLRKNLETILDKILLLPDLMNRLRAVYSIQSDKLNLLNKTYSKFPSYGPNIIDGGTILSDIYNLIDSIDYIGSYVAVVLMDVYFLRRYLDKDYIKNAISYTGSRHSLNYIDILVKTFDFKITHASYSKYDIPQLNEKIHESEIELSHLFLPLQLQQCSDVSSFPPGFD